jgi:hypothetical protein
MPEDGIFHSQFRENLKSYAAINAFFVRIVGSITCIFLKTVVYVEGKYGAMIINIEW